MLRRLDKFEHVNSKLIPNIDNRGFTLLELLVVISIISLMTAITLPVISNIQKYMRDTQCLFRMRGLGFATSVYRHDNNGRFPQPTENTNLLKSKGGKYEDHIVASALWFNAVDIYLGLEQKKYQTWWDDNESDRNYSKLKQDPVWQTFDAEGKKRNRTIKMSQYFKIDSTLGVTHVKSPRRTLLYVDARAQDTVKSSSAYCAYFWTTAGVVSLRHQGGANVAFADGHVELVHQKVNYSLAAPGWFTPSKLKGQKIIWDVSK